MFTNTIKEKIGWSFPNLAQDAFNQTSNNIWDALGEAGVLSGADKICMLLLNSNESIMGSKSESTSVSLRTTILSEQIDEI